MRSGPLLLTGAGLLAATHALGVLLATPVWRFAEIAFLGALLAYSVVRGLPAPRWLVPAVLATLAVDAVRTLPAEPNPAAYGWMVFITEFADDTGVDTTAGLESTLAVWWAPLAATVLPLIMWRPDRRPSRAVVAGALVGALLILGYAMFRVIIVGQAVTAVILALMPVVALGLAAPALAALLAGAGHRLAAAGAVLLAVVMLPNIDTAIEATALPLRAADRGELFGWDLIHPTLVMPQPMPALTTAVEMAAFLLLVAGLSGRRGATVSLPAR